jgi:ribonuclease P protein component
MRFRADQHLRRASDFTHVRTQGRRFDCGAFVLFYAPRRAPAAASSQGQAPAVEASVPGVEVPPPLARAGFVASRSAVGNAVERARAKRRLREGFRAHQTCFPAGVDFIFVARRSLNGLEQVALERRFGDLCRKLFPPLVS